MNTANDIEQIIRLKKSRETKLQKRSVVFAVLIVLSSCAWLLFSSNKIESQRKENKKLLVEKRKLEGEVKLLQVTLDSVSKLSKYSVDVRFDDIKPIYGSNPMVASLLGELLLLKEAEPTFVYEATATLQYINQNEFSSPSLMIYLLKKNGLVDIKGESRVELQDYFTNRSATIGMDSIRTGDIIFYKNGYVMLYILNAHADANHTLRKEYCIGMTPMGILTLRPDFAEALQIVRTGFK